MVFNSPKRILQMQGVPFLYKEIAEILNLTETNAKVKLYRILERVKKTLTKKSK